MEIDTVRVMNGKGEGEGRGEIELSRPICPKGMLRWVHVCLSRHPPPSPQYHYFPSFSLSSTCKPVKSVYLPVHIPKISNRNESLSLKSLNQRSEQNTGRLVDHHSQATINKPKKLRFGFGLGLNLAMACRTRNRGKKGKRGKRIKYSDDPYPLTGKLTHTHTHTRNDLITSPYHP
jgi:hypothetical protein